MSHFLQLDGASLTIDQVVSAARDPSISITLDPAALAALGRSRAQIERAIEFIEELHLAEILASDIEIVNLPYEPHTYEDPSVDQPDAEE